MIVTVIQLGMKKTTSQVYSLTEAAFVSQLAGASVR